ncbi:MAG: murein transglycosylase A [Azoarcus sp.]|jgi:membrane-bound lytic murein transglycosylase A|nr:murein transglycosylase A [Azoarcus sp.]
MNQPSRHRLIFLTFIVAAAALAGCTQLPPKAEVPETDHSIPAPPPPDPDICVDCATPVPPDDPPSDPSAWRESHWNDLPGWDDDAMGAAWPAFRESCRAIGRKSTWTAVCAAADMLPGTLSDREARQFFEQHFIPRQSVAKNGNTQGLVTGYYEPLIHGSRTQSSGTQRPILATPNDMLTVDFVKIYPELRSMNLRGRLAGKKVLPYWTRAELEKLRAEGKLPARILLWADDPVDLFFLQIQGSGQVELPDGSRVRIGFAEHNGHPYRSIGNWLIERGELASHQASMQGIRQWVHRNPHRLDELLNSNPRFVFFRELPAGEGGPIGALGVPLHAERSIAVDPAHVPLGAPVFLSTTWPLSDKPLNRLLMAQDTGSAIKGAVRADFFWGFGDEAGEQAGKMRQQGKMWILWPKVK